MFISVPPTEAIIMDEFGQHLHGIIGPYNEGQPVSLICEGEGGELFSHIYLKLCNCVYCLQNRNNYN